MGAATAQRAAGFADEPRRKELLNQVKPADWFAAAAERFAFPKGKCAHTFVDEPLFCHPLSSKRYPFSAKFADQAGLASEALQTAIAGLPLSNRHETFFLYWRRWLENAAARLPDLAFLPADTRIPDHSIWNHMSVVAALAPCRVEGKVRPELLLFQWGPVQDFIAQARSTRDLWSGSYLISWLMAHAMKAVTDQVGPDAIIFPSLRGNGIFDALHKDTFYRAAWKSGDNGETRTTWERLLEDKGGWDRMADWLLTPTLPNRFLAIVPPGTGAGLAEQARDALTAELRAMGEQVWSWLLNQGASPGWKARWDRQIAVFPQTAWAVQPWLEREACLAEAEKLSPGKRGNQQNPDESPGVVERIKAFLKLAESQIPEKDERCYEPEGHLRNSGFLWSAHYALLDARLAARRNTRNFAAWEPAGRDAAVKDSLSGREECLGDEAFWKALTERHPDLFKAASHRYGAMNLIKRLWCRPEAVDYLPRKLGLESRLIHRALRADSTEAIAAQNVSFAPDSGDEPSGVTHNSYIAILAMDGDEMGRWVSGALAPEFLLQVAPNAQSYLKVAAGMSRLLTPSYHLQFSEALANFALRKARETVEAFGGNLIYAGGDDVLAILPATRAIACAERLREAFRADFEGGRIFPGSRCEVSCGIAVGHQHAPLQMLVNEARAAERRAKTVYARAALAVNLYKRSGEIIEWGCKWQDPALPLMRRVTDLTAAGKLSGRFPYALASVLRPYAFDRATLDDLQALRAVAQAEARHVLSRQGEKLSPAERAELEDRIACHLKVCWEEPVASGKRPNKSNGPGPRALDFLNLFLVEAFINRARGED